MNEKIQAQRNELKKFNRIQAERPSCSSRRRDKMERKIRLRSIIDLGVDPNDLRLRDFQAVN